MVSLAFTRWQMANGQPVDFSVDWRAEVIEPDFYNPHGATRRHDRRRNAPFAAEARWLSGLPDTVRHPDSHELISVSRDERTVLIPLLMPAALFLWPPLLAALGWLAGRRLEGCCAFCRYDLRGSPGDRCPECGRQREQSTYRVSWRSRVTVGIVAGLILTAAWLMIVSACQFRRPMPLLFTTFATNPKAPAENAPLEEWTIRSAVIWLESGSVHALLHSGGETPTHIAPRWAASRAPPRTGLLWLEPAFLHSESKSSSAWLIRLPLLAVFGVLGLALILWFRRVRRLGGLYLGRLNLDPPPPDAPAAP